jgi:hypothetical protein
LFWQIGSITVPRLAPGMYACGAYGSHPFLRMMEAASRASTVARQMS